MAIQFLALYSSNCKICKSLDPTEEKEFPRCHFSKGNNDCPASEIQFAVVGKAQRLAKRVIAARESRKAVVEARILSEVVKEGKAFQTRFYDVLDSLERDSCPPVTEEAAVKRRPSSKRPLRARSSR